MTLSINYRLQSTKNPVMPAFLPSETHIIVYNIIIKLIITIVPQSLQ